MNLPNIRDSILKIVGTIILLGGGFMAFDNFFNTRIDKRINNPEYISHLSKSLRPYLIFNDKGNYKYDHGAEIFLDSISVKMNLNLESGEPIIIKVYPKKSFKVNPLLQSISGIAYNETIEIQGNKTIVYTLNVTGYNESTEYLFLLEILY